MNTMSLAVFCILAITTCPGFSAESGTPLVQTNMLARYRTTYETTAAKITSETQQKKVDALVQYGKTLDSAMTVLKQKGDIDNFGIIDAEAKRFATDKTILTNATQPYVVSAVAKYQKLIAEIEADSTLRQVNLLKKYITALNGLVRDLMAKDKIEEAKAVGDIRKTAEVLLSDMETIGGKTAPASLVASSLPQSPEVSPTHNDRAEAKTEQSDGGAILNRKASTQAAIPGSKTNAIKSLLGLWQGENYQCELHEDGRWEMLGDASKDWSGSFVYLNPSKTKIKRECDNDKTFRLEYKPAKDILLQNDGSVLHRIKK